jgi:hypothetical protein
MVLGYVVFSAVLTLLLSSLLARDGCLDAFLAEWLDVRQVTLPRAIFLNLFSTR